MTHGSASGLWQEHLWEASHYLVKQVFNSIKEMFSATRDIQVRSLLPLTSTFSSSLVYSYIDKGMIHGEKWFSWLLAQRGSSCPSAEMWGCAKLPSKRWTVTVCGRREGGLCWEGMGSPSSTLTPAASSLLLKNWLTESAKLIAQSGRTVEWVTPLGLPIIQPYYRSRSTVVSVQCEISWHTFPVPWWEQGKDSWARAQQVGITGG